MDDYLLREMRQEDLNFLHSLWSDREAVGCSHNRNVHTDMQISRRVLSYLLEVQKDPLTEGFFRITETAEGVPAAWSEVLFPGGFWTLRILVGRNMQGSGAGAWTLTAMEQEAAARGCTVLAAGVRTECLRTEKWFRRKGYIKTAGKGENLIYLSKTLG